MNLCVTELQKEIGTAIGTNSLRHWETLRFPAELGPPLETQNYNVPHYWRSPCLINRGLSPCFSGVSRDSPNQSVRVSLQHAQKSMVVLSTESLLKRMSHGNAERFIKSKQHCLHNKKKKQKQKTMKIALSETMGTVANLRNLRFFLAQVHKSPSQTQKDLQEKCWLFCFH